MTDPARYPIPGAVHRAEEEIKNSRFIATAGTAATEEEAREFVESIRREFPDATHNCWAYLIGPPGSTLRAGSSDDGEPAGTAGRPMLTVLLNSGMGDVAVVVTRYFGGTKLGRGGLVRAYGGSVQRVLNEMPVAEHVEFAALNVGVEYAAVDALRKLVTGHGGSIEEELFEASARFKVLVPEENVRAFEIAVLDVTNGKAAVDRNGED